MSNTGFRFVVLLLSIVMLSACQPPELHHVIVNTTDANLAVKYKLARCGAGDSWGSWQPEMLGETNFENGDGAWTVLRDGQYVLEKGTEAAPPRADGLIGQCLTETYTIEVAPHTAVKFHKGDFRPPQIIKLLEIKGAAGEIAYSGDAPLIMRNFKSYSNKWFDIFGHSLAVLQY